MTRRSSGDEVEAARVRKPAPPIDDLPLFGGESAPVEQPVHLVSVRAHQRRVPGEAPPSGKELRDSALAAHEADDAKREALDYVRGRLVDLYRERVRDAYWTGQRAYVTGDDADRLLREWPEYPKALHDVGNNWRGAIFNPSAWERTGEDVESTRPHMKGTRMSCWRLRDVAQEKAS